MKNNYKTGLMLLTVVLVFSCGKNNHNTVVIDNSPEKNIRKATQSISQKLRENDHLPIAERIDLYHQLKKEFPNDYNFKNEDELTMYGYSFLWNNEIDDAIEIFKLIVDQFPNSSNPYDSLGEGYMVQGNNNLAILNYKKSLELNPHNFNAEDQIERMNFPNRIAEKPAELFTKVYSISEYKSDLDQLGKTLIEVNPNALKFIRKDEFLKIIENKKSLITASTTYGEFVWHCSEVIASINCSHTTMGSFNYEASLLPTSLRFPIQSRWVNNQLFVIDPLNNSNKVAIKDEIVRINGILVSEIVSDIYKHIQSQGHVETSKNHFFNKWSTGLISYALGFPKSYQIEVKGKNYPILLNKAKTTLDPVNDSSIKQNEGDLNLKFLADDKKALMTIATFNYYPWNNLKVFKDFIDNSFKKLEEKKVEHLIIDLRQNGGGSQHSSIHLLKYLMDKPFTYYAPNTNITKGDIGFGEEVEYPFKNKFNGKCYFIIDGNGKSTTGHFMSIVKALKLGTIVGEELGSNQLCTAGQTVCRLSNTKLNYYVANVSIKSLATSLPDETGILPDHYITQSIDEYLNSVDSVLEFTLDLID